MNRMSVSKTRVSVLLSGLVAIPVPWTSATPTKPLKSVMEDGSIPGPKNERLKVTPLIVNWLAVGLGAALPLLARTLAGIRPAPTVAPATRSEERRVGKESRSRWSPDQETKKQSS